MIATGRRLHILLICTRDPRGRMSGRKMVLQTILRSLTGLGHRVTVAHFGPPAEGAEAGQDGAAGAVTYLRLPMPQRWELAAGGVGALLLGRRSLNEALYASRRARAALADLLAAGDHDMVITDMIRTAPYGADAGLPWIADLDDLLSLRYARVAGQGAGQGLLGYHRAPVLGWALRRLARVQPALLRREAALLAGREADVARRAHLVTLVSRAEAAQLSQATGRPVVATPMAVAGAEAVAPLAARPFEAVFLGGLDYGPNLSALRHFDSDLIPALAAQGIGDFSLQVIGFADAAHRRGLSDRIVFRGYCPDLQAALQQYRLMLVPEVTPGGVKTKIIEAALAGTLVVAHETALDGMAFRPGVEALVWRDAAGLAAHVAGLRAGRINADALVGAARAAAQAQFSPEVLRTRWRENLEACLAAAPPRPP